jgi:hypothetical protein
MDDFDSPNMLKAVEELEEEELLGGTRTLGSSRRCR